MDIRNVASMNRWLMLGSLLVLVGELALTGPRIVEVGHSDPPSPPPPPSSVPDDLRLKATQVVSGLAPLTDVVGDPDSDRLYIVEKAGRILVFEDGQVQEEPFIDLTDWVLSTGNEQGLVTFVLDPDFSENRRGYVFYTEPSQDALLVELRASPDGRRAELGSLRPILHIPQPNGQYHQSGSVAFDNDGLMWISIGDGGGIGDPDRNGQNASNIYATILRLKVGERTPYLIPDDNPFVGSDEGMPEIWAYGVRNPWRMTIDIPTSQVIIPDVGQEGFEEINIVSMDDSGRNFGWSTTEGTSCYREDGCDMTGITMPAYQYPHAGDGCAIVGGMIYRGSAIPEMTGHYFFGDYCLGWIRSVGIDEGEVFDETDWREQLGRLGNITSIGTDRNGEIYVVNLDGEVWRIDKSSG